ncbi:MAG TPA: ATP-binding protein [Jatrophihabitans sp.]|uniref:GAF domain-containing sensor histidine kinase n=1 Tax=Jatrophihabitans sp. TaxID=1932789 RepID=UPI002DFFD211|nr:ATP-binding protein [Jatrophihabitans sp.]
MSDGKQAPSDRVVAHAAALDPAASTRHSLDVIMRAAVRGVRGDFALVAIRTDEDRILIQAALGPVAEDMVGNLMLIDASVAAPVFRRGAPLLVPDYPDRGGAAPEVRVRIGSVIVVPLEADGYVEAALAVGRLSGQPTFTRAALDELDAFVRRAGTAREVEHARDERQLARLVEDRARISADLHDHVIQELFAAAMTLHGLAGALADPEHARIVSAQVDALDATSNRIRSLISEIPRSLRSVRRTSLPKRLIAIVDSITPALDCLPTVSFVGPVDSSVDDVLGEDLEAVLREALTNVARHAGASTVKVRVAFIDSTLTLDVIDDGRGLGDSERRSGLRNMSVRAERHNGALAYSEPDGGGTRLTWHAPIGTGVADPRVSGSRG